MAHPSQGSGGGGRVITVPVSGIPRIVRPRKRWGTVYGFSLVDVGGNWLGIARLGDSEDQDAESEAVLARPLAVRRGQGLRVPRSDRPDCLLARAGQSSRHGRSLGSHAGTAAR
jgi:hypothetical protein